MYDALWANRRVAVKKLKQFFVELDPEALAMFEEEVRFMQSTRHHNIVFFYGAGDDEEEGTKFIVTEFMERGSLRNVLDNKGQFSGEVARSRERSTRKRVNVSARGERRRKAQIQKEETGDVCLFTSEGGEMYEMYDTL